MISSVPCRLRFIVRALLGHSCPLALTHTGSDFQGQVTLNTLRRVALSEFAAAAPDAASPIAAKMYILADGSHVWVRRRSTDSNDFVISEDQTGQNPPLPDSPQVAIAHDKVLEVLRIIIDSSRRELANTNASLTRQRDIAREAIYAVSKATNCDVCDELGSRSVADAFMSAWMNGPSGAPFKDAPEEERQLRALADFSIYNAKRLFEETRRARLAEAEVQLSTYTDWESAPRNRAIEPLINIHNTRKELLGDSHVDTIKSLWMLGALRFEKGELDRGLADLRLSVSTLEALPAKPFDLLAAMYDNLLHAELVLGNWDAAMSIVDRLRSLITSDEALNGNWTNSGFGPFRPHFLYTPRLFTWQDAFVQTSHAKAIEAMRQKLSEFKGQSLETRYAPIVRDWALGAVVEAGDPNWAPFLANVKRRAALTATTLTPTDPEALTALALSHYRAGEFSDAMPVISKAIQLRASRSEEASPIAAAAEAMICFQIGDEAHVARARAALTRAKSLPIDSTNTKPWARSNHSKPILAEAQALIEGVKPK
jgi:tetratricopeptide (TPR) repeat protein